MATDMQMGLVSAFGASPTVVAYGELYTAQQQGTIDGMLTATSLYRTDKFAEVIDHLSIVRTTAHFHLPTINKAWLGSLDPETRAIFDGCIKDYVAYGREQKKKLDTDMLASMGKDFKVQIRQYSEEELKPFKAAVKEMWTKNYDKPGKGVLDEVLKFLGKDFNTLLQ
jgi:TRAP-type C4-dicarboxylate transport system substrate-binding protein